MLDFRSIMDLQLIMFFLMLIGAVLSKMNIINAAGRRMITDLLIDVILPANIICSFMVELSKKIIFSAIVVLFIAFGVQVVSYLLSKILYLKVEPSKNKVLRYATLCSNAGFMGNPIVEGIYGSMGLLYASIYLIPLRFFMWTAGLSCFTQTDFRSTIKKLALHPCIIAVWIGFVLMIFKIELPSFVDKTLHYISACTLPISILIIGTILAEVNYKTIVTKLTLYFCAVRLILIPCIVFIVCRLLHVDALITGVSVVLSGMPAGSTTAILAEKYNGDSKYASKCVFLSTLLSLITIPILCLAVERL